MSDELGRLDTRAREVIAAKLKAEEAEQVAKGLRAKHRELEAAFWDDLDEYSGLKSFKLENDPVYGNVTITRRSTIVAGVLNEDEAIDAIQQDPGLAAALLGRHKIRAKVANELARERAKSGEPMPDGMEIVERKGLTISIKKGG